MNPNAWWWDDFGTVQGLIVNATAGNIGSLNVSAREVARLGHLFLNRGNWRGVQLVGAAWIAAATSPQVPVTIPLGNCLLSSFDGRGVYGFGWWANGVRSNTQYDADCNAFSTVGQYYWPHAPAGTFSASGYNNKMFVVPEWQMVIVRLDADDFQTARISETIFDEFLRLIGNAILVQ